MTHDEITLFRRFMTNKGILNDFEFLYAQHRFADVSIDKFYESTEAANVIMTAFDFSGCGNTIFRREYWENIDSKWQKALFAFRSDGEMPQDLKIRCAKCGKAKSLYEFVIKKNGQPHKFCKECEGWAPAHPSMEYTIKPVMKVCRRCGKTKMLDAFYVSSSSSDGVQSWCKDCMAEYHKTHKSNHEPTEDGGKQTLLFTETETETTKTNNDMEDFTFYDFDTKCDRRRMQEGTASINNSAGHKNISFGVQECGAIIDRGFLRLRLAANNLTGELFFVFNAENGAPVSVKRGKSVSIYNKELVDFVMSHLGLGDKDGRYIINIGKNLSNTEDKIVFLVKRCDR